MEGERAVRVPRRSKRALGAEEVAGEDVDLILALLNSETVAAVTPPTNRRRTLRAVCLTASRIKDAAGKLVCEQHVGGEDVQELRLANASLGEKQWFLVHYKDACEEPSWERTVDVGKPLIKQFKHLLHLFPHVRQPPMPGAAAISVLHRLFTFFCLLSLAPSFFSLSRPADKLALLVDDAAFNLGVGMNMDLREKTRILPPQCVHVVTATLKVDAQVFLALFGQTAAFRGETYTSLLAHRATSRNVTFEEMDAVLGPVFAAANTRGARWDSRTNKLGASARVSREEPLRLSIHLLNSVDFNHSDCPNCTYSIDMPLLCELCACLGVCLL